MRIRNYKNREGLTLLFVVSMIVLFLLMGTTFVVISNDYFRAARKRSQARLHTVDRTALVQQAFLDFVRGPDLLNVNSPIRGHDLLSDQYGYGFKATVFAAAPVDATRGQLIEIVLATTSTNFRPPAQLALDSGQQILGLRDMLADAKAISESAAYPDDKSGRVYHAGSTSWRDPDDPVFTTPTNKDILLGLDTPGYFSGQIMTFTNGQAKGVSARIVDYTVTEDTTFTPPVMVRKFIILPERVPNGANTPFDTAAEVGLLGESRNGAGVLVNTPSTILINGRPYSGIGAGTMADYSAFGVAAGRPNNAHYGVDSQPTAVGSTFWDPNADPFFNAYSLFRNAVNEPYDAHDHDNVFLAQNIPGGGVVASFNPVQLAGKHLGVNQSDHMITPRRVIQHNTHSFRPVFQWDPEYINDPANPRVLDSSTATSAFPNLWDTTVPVANRPAGYQALGIPHELQTRPLDVDNDGDGVLDSVWIDMGYSIITTPDGKRYKPMVAPMIVDMDNRLNVNVHGSFADAQSRATLNAADRPGTYTPGFMTYADLLGIDSSVDNAATQSWELARGLGWGPAEISLAPLLADYRPLLVGSPTPSVANPFSNFPAVPGRYGVDRFPGNSFFDTPAQFRFLDHPYPGVIGGTFEGRSLDIQGRFATGFPQLFETYTIPDPANPGMTINVNAPYGTPIVDIASSEWPPVGPLSNSDPSNPYPGFGFEPYNSPYEVSLNQDTRRSDDLLFSPEELEAFLRRFDIDSELLASRLLTFGVNPTTSRHLVTTDSWEVPMLPPTLFDRGGTTVNQTIPERLYSILTSATPDNNYFLSPQIQDLAFMNMRGGILETRTGTNTRTVIHSLLAPEVMRGLPMNVNRVFGDGVDNNGNGIVDEHWDSPAADDNEVVDESYPLNPTIAMDHNNDGISDRQDRFARQIFARHLFVLTWLVAGGDFDPASASGRLNPPPPDMTNRGNFATTIAEADEDILFLAQWCANVVDFRDADSICTPFKYDKNPWDGWDENPYLETTDPDAYDVSVGSPNGVVWGTERPELLVTESIATHERRYEDDGSGGWQSDFVPKASVFVEVYNPWTNTSFSADTPSEFYRNGGVDLAQHHNSVRTPVAGTGDPVWRLAFVQGRGDSATDLDSRRVYMREPTINVEASAAGNFWYPSLTALDAVDMNGNSNGEIDNGELGIPANRYAVIGSSGVERATGEFRTTFGRRTDLGPSPPMDLKLDETRSITLIPGQGVETVDGDDGSAMNTEMRRCVAVPIDTKGTGASLEVRSFGLTDPIAGYPASQDIDPDGDTDPSDGDGKRFLATQVPVADDQTDFIEVFREGVSYANPNSPDTNKRPNFVKLQRLANPTMPFDGKLNPYITVDVAPIDLVSFNGLADTDDDISNAMADVATFDTHERGDNNGIGNPTWLDPSPTAIPPAAENERHLWSEENVRDVMMDVPKEINDQHFFPQQFTETFGFMNRTYQGYDANVAATPFLWCTWNNRPYISQYELMNVPRWHALEFLNNFTKDGNHVLQMNDSTVKRVLDFLDVPSRFVNMEVGFVASAFAGEIPLMVDDQVNGEVWVERPTVFNPPNNFVSRYRYPGKVNVNTMLPNQAPVFNVGMMDKWGLGYAGLTGVRGDATLNNNPEDQGVYGSSATAAGTMISMNPLRSNGSGNVEMPTIPSGTFNVATNAATYGTPPKSDGSILRDGGNSNFFRTSPLPHEDTTRNYNFQNSAISKLANISTNRSSVYAIWITVGYFEVDDSGRIGAEVGSDTGEVTRNRGFYIYDRSIPVGFEPGKNHNVERGILVQSIIE